MSLEVKALIKEIRAIQNDVDYKKLIIRGGNKVTYDFSSYKTFNELYRDLYYKKMTISDAEMRQNEFNSILHADDDEPEQQPTNKIPTKDDVNAFSEQINKKETGIIRNYLKIF